MVPLDKQTETPFTFTSVEAFKVPVRFTNPPVPLFGSSAILPVVVPPIVKVLLRKLCREVFAASRTKPKLFVVAAKVATGVPTPIPLTANCALAVAFDPSKRSSLVLRCMIALLLSSVNGEPPLIIGRMPETLVPAKFNALAVTVPFDAWSTPLKPVKVIVPALTVRPLLAANVPVTLTNPPVPLLGSSAMFPVVAPPIVRVLLFKD